MEAKFMVEKDFLAKLKLNTSNYNPLSIRYVLLSY